MQDIMIIKRSIYLHFKTKTHLFSGQVYDFFLSKKFKIMGMNVTMTFYGLKMHPYMELY
jgi:hypothetical protein